MTYKIIFGAPLPAPIVELAQRMAPSNFAVVAINQDSPELYSQVADANYFMTGFVRGGIDDRFYAAARKLRLIQLIGAGYDRLDIEAARRANVPIATNGGANSVAVAEHTLLLMLAVLRRLTWQHANVTAGRWRVGTHAEHRFHEMAGKQLGLIGLGAIGKKVVQRARAFDMNVAYYDLDRLSEYEEDNLGVRFLLLDELLRSSDIVSIHVPLTTATRALIGKEALAMMKPDAIIINTSRGPIIAQHALIEALQNKRIAGAGLDVLETEPPPADHPLFRLDNVVLTPHTAGPTWENWTKSFRNSFYNIERVARGAKPLWVIPELA